MKFRTLVIFALIAVFLAGVFLQAQSAVEIRAASSTAVAGWQRVTAADGEAIWVAPTASLTSADFASGVSHTMRDGRDAVGVEFTAEGARKMRALSAAKTNQRIALLLEGKVIWAPVVRSRSNREAQLTGLSRDQAKRLVTAVGKVTLENTVAIRRTASGSSRSFSHAKLKRANGAGGRRRRSGGRCTTRPRARGCGAPRRRRRRRCATGPTTPCRRRRG